jgi:hypothetical protein
MHTHIDGCIGKTEIETYVRFAFQVSPTSIVIARVTVTFSQAAGVLCGTPVSGVTDPFLFLVSVGSDPFGYSREVADIDGVRESDSGADIRSADEIPLAAGVTVAVTFVNLTSADGFTISGAAAGVSFRFQTDVHVTREADPIAVVLSADEPADTIGIIIAISFSDVAGTAGRASTPIDIVHVDWPTIDSVDDPLVKDRRIRHGTSGIRGKTFQEEDAFLELGIIPNRRSGIAAFDCRVQIRTGYPCAVRCYIDARPSAPTPSTVLPCALLSDTDSRIYSTEVHDPVIGVHIDP